MAKNKEVTYNFSITSPFSKPSKKMINEAMKRQNYVRRKAEDIQADIRLQKELNL